MPLRMCSSWAGAILLSKLPMAPSSLNRNPLYTALSFSVWGTMSAARSARIWKNWWCRIKYFLGSQGDLSFFCHECLGVLSCSCNTAPTDRDAVMVCINAPLLTGRQAPLTGSIHPLVGSASAACISFSSASTNPNPPQDVGTGSGMRVTRCAYGEPRNRGRLTTPAIFGWMRMENESGGSCMKNACHASSISTPSYIMNRNASRWGAATSYGGGEVSLGSGRSTRGEPGEGTGFTAGLPVAARPPTGEAAGVGSLVSSLGAPAAPGVASDVDGGESGSLEVEEEEDDELLLSLLSLEVVVMLVSSSLLLLLLLPLLLAAGAGGDGTGSGTPGFTRSSAAAFSFAGTDPFFATTGTLIIDGFFFPRGSSSLLLLVVVSPLPPISVPDSRSDTNMAPSTIKKMNTKQ